MFQGANLQVCLLLLLSHFSCVRLLETPRTAAYQAPLSIGFSRQEYWSGVPLPSPSSLSRTVVFIVDSDLTSECLIYLACELPGISI